MEKLPLILRPSKLKTLVLLIICLVFSFGGIFLIRKGDNMGWLVFSFFFIGVIVFIITLLPNSSYLKISVEGIEIKTLFKKSQMISWGVIDEFGAAYIGVNKMVTINFNENYNQQKVGRNVASSLTGFEGALPDTYGMDASKLANLLNDYKNKFS